MRFSALRTDPTREIAPDYRPRIEPIRNLRIHMTWGVRLCLNPTQFKISFSFTAPVPERLSERQLVAYHGYRENLREPHLPIPPLRPGDRRDFTLEPTHDHASTWLRKLIRFGLIAIIRY